MLRPYEPVLRILLMLADATLALAVLIVAAMVHPDGGGWVIAIPYPGVLAVFYAVVWVSLLSANGLYYPRIWLSFRSETNGIIRATFWLALVVLASVVLLDLDRVSRFFLLVLIPVQGAATIAVRMAMHALFRTLRRRGRNLRTVLIVGGGPDAAAFGQLLERRWDLGLTVEGVLADDPASVGETRWPWLGPVAKLPDVLHERVIDEVAVCVDLKDWHLVEAVSGVSASEGKTVRIPLHVPHTALAVGHIEDLENQPIVSLVSGPDRGGALAVKRLIDFAGAAIGLIVLTPLFVIVSIAILVRDGRPVLFRQERAGLNGRSFRIVKFRTMGRDADAQRAQLREHNEVSGNASFKMTNDPRVTPLGKVLRRTSIDELPQLWNVLRGEMSLVGPRPHPFDDVAGYDGWHRRRLSMKPGITGVWQVASRREADFDRWVQQDLDYIDSWSLGLDISLILRTIPALLRAEGR